MDNKLSLIQKYHPYFDLNSINQVKPYQLIPTKVNSPTIKIDIDNHELYLHSKYNPMQEALNLIKNFQCAQNEVVFILGIGLGYHLLELIKTYPDNYFVVIEADMRIYRTYLNNISDDTLKNQKIIYLTEKDCNDLNNFISYLTISKLKEKVRFKIFKHITSVKLYPEKYKMIENSLMESFSYYYSNILTEKEFQPLWEKNIKKNIKEFKQSNKLKELKNIYKNKPMIIVCAGPSVEKNLKFIKDNQEKMIVLTVDTALRFLLKNGITPHYVLSLDAKYENLGDFKFLNLTDDINLIYDIVSFPRIQKLFKKKYVTYTLKMIKDFNSKEWNEYHDELIEPVIKKYGDFGGLQSGGSVATNALDFALITGADPIYFTGLDLCYINYKTHCRGSFKEKYLLNRTNKFYNYETINFFSVVSRQNVRKIEGNNIYHYDFILRKYQKWFDEAFTLIKDRKIVRL